MKEVMQQTTEARVYFQDGYLNHIYDEGTQGPCECVDMIFGP